MKHFLRSLFPDTHPLRLFYHRVRGELAAFFAGYPARRLTVIAVTGTDGKTTTVAMIAHILRYARKSVGAASTAFLEIEGQREPNATQKTSLTATQMQSFLRRLVERGCEYAVVEVSSHGLMQGRFCGITPTVAAITNVSMEHLDYHGSMEEYIRAKGLLFRALRGHGAKVLNADDESFAAYLPLTSDTVFRYSPRTQLSSIVASADSTSAQVLFEGSSLRLRLSVPGIFNLSNALCALCCTRAVGIPVDVAVQALESFHGAPGRMERIDCGQPFSVYIDFTVTPVAYEKTLDSLRSTLPPTGRLLVLTGSCGDRMPEKRPLVGKICSQKADIVVVTNEDPYTENPEKIIDDVLGGIASSMPVYRNIEEYRQRKSDTTSFCVRISDRREAIYFILQLARPGDAVLLAGKGADITMMVGTSPVAWNEKAIVTETLQRLRR